MKDGERESGSRIQRDYQPVQPTFAQTSAEPGTRAAQAPIDDMGPGTDRPEPLRDAAAVSRIRKPDARRDGLRPQPPDPRARLPLPASGERAGVRGSNKSVRGRVLRPESGYRPAHQGRRLRREVKGPHKPTLDEMGPTPSAASPSAGKPPALPRTADGSPSPSRGGVRGEGNPR